MPKTYRLIFPIFALVVASCSLLDPIPQPKREFRGFWVATVVNIDWPKSGTDDVQKQKADFLDILDFYDDLNFNAAIVQVRTAGDAFYKSDFAPWSRFLTGKEGKAPETEKSILRWMIQETHARGMEFHAWLNPYRATFDLKTDILSADHDYHKHPEWMLKYGQKYYYDPGLPEVRERMISVIDELVSNFDIDAVHFDDYFYPYTIAGELFDDTQSYAAHSLEGQSLEDWRRSNIDSLVKDSYEIIKGRKPWVQLGISPFGIWRNKATDPRGSDTEAGQTTYDNLYADPLLWMKKGWLDYIVPQVYWSMDFPVASHRKIVAWWAENAKNTNLYIGNGPYKVRNNKDEAWDHKKELPRQINLGRDIRRVEGNVFFSAKSLMQNKAAVVKHLRRKYYRREALAPISPWAPGRVTGSVSLDSMKKMHHGKLLYFSDLSAFRFATIYKPSNGETTSYPMKRLLAKLPVGQNDSVYLDRETISKHGQVALIFIDRFGREQEPIFIDVKR